MRSIAQFMSMLVLASFVFTGIVNAQDEAKPKGKKQQGQLSVVDQFLKQLEPAELSDEQKAAAKEILGAVQKDVAAKRTEAGITPEILKKRAAARKEGNEAGKKGAELKKHVEAAMGLTADQLKVLDETEKALTKAKQEIGKKLSPEQIAKLPEQARKAVETPAPKQGGKKKKDGDK
jgi:hypothetical protein